MEPPITTGTRGVDDPNREKPPRRRVNYAAIVIGMLIAMTPEPSSAILVGVLAGVVLLTAKWIRYRWEQTRF